MQEHEPWLRIAREDLLAAKGLLRLELFSSVTFHCQQVAEKSLKGYLVFQKQTILRTHDLIKLIELCVKIGKAFDKVKDEAALLNPFSTKFRYPSEYDIPNFADAKIAIKQAQSIMTFVTKKIKELPTGQTAIFGSNHAEV